ncbi:hypothetical protein GBF38_014758 [Nibea albiflora]|uniref:Uncharacterized protein n=1 Tax=Nibea albiflora TaxID=240163 RepID=A0ACB7EKP6_NIBAL|nr:hypothetical protein GBF38_014758 [Nibea albiflora]
MAGPKSKARTILETAVTIIRDPESTSYIPRKNVVHLRRTQRPPTEPLREEWSLEPYGMRGSWGYVFKYETGELCLYQLEEGHVRRPSGDAATMSSADWGVLKTVNPKNLAEYEEEFSAEVSHAYPREYLARKSTFMAVWLAKTSGTARWFFRASYRVKDYFVLDLFSSDCGVFRTLLIIPLAAWNEKMEQVCGRIDSLFHSSRNWNEALVVKKNAPLQDHSHRSSSSF